MSENRHALIVATSKYKDDRLAALEGPGHDAEALRGVLADAAIGGFTVKLAMNSRVDSLRRTLETFFMNRSRDDLLLVHFSGHGLKDDDGQLYLAAADTEIDRLLSTGVDAGWVNRLMNRCRSEKIALFLDCCFAGAFTSGMTRRTGTDTAGVKEQFNGSGLFVITASDAMQYSFEGGRQVGDLPEPSPFTKALVDGLRTGEADRNEDGVVSMNELFDYLEDRVRQTSPAQTPTKSAFNQVGDWAIARSTRVPSVRLLPEDLQMLLKSEDALDRFGALIDLRDIIEGPDRRTAEAGLQALQRLTEDDSRRVAAAAKRLYAEETSRPKPAPRGPRRHAAPAPADPPPAVTAIDPPPPEPVALEPAAIEALSEPAAMTAAAAVDIQAAAPEHEPVAASEPFLPPRRVGQANQVANMAPTEAPGIAPTPSSPTEPEAAEPFLPPRRVAEFDQIADDPNLARSDAAAPAATTAAWTADQMVAPRVAMAEATPAPRPAPASEPTATAWSARRSISRAAIGTPIFLAIGYAKYLDSNSSWIFDDVSNIESSLASFATWFVPVVFWAVVLVLIVERLVPAVRVPGGSAYRIVGGNRWAAAALLGAAVGLAIGVVVEFALFANANPETIVFAAGGFVIAEALVGRRFTGQDRARSASA